MRNGDLAINFSKGETAGQGSNMFISENTIYSYGFHFPIAIRLNDVEKVKTGYSYIYNSNGYSNTTAAHKAKVRYAINNYIELPDCDTSKETLENLIEDFKSQIADMEKKISRLSNPEGVRGKQYQSKLNALLDKLDMYKKFKNDLYGGNSVDFIQQDQ